MTQVSNNELKPPPWEKIHQQLGVSLPQSANQPLASFLENYAESNPKSVAVSYYTRDINYSELNQLTNCTPKRKLWPPI